MTVRVVLYLSQRFPLDPRKQTVLQRADPLHRDECIPLAMDEKCGEGGASEEQSAFGDPAGIAVPKLSQHLSDSITVCSTMRSAL